MAVRVRFEIVLEIGEDSLLNHTLVIVPLWLKLADKRLGLLLCYRPSALKLIGVVDR